MPQAEKLLNKYAQKHTPTPIYHFRFYLFLKALKCSIIFPFVLFRSPLPFIFK